MLTPKYIWRRY